MIYHRKELLHFIGNKVDGACIFDMVQGKPNYLDLSELRLNVNVLINTLKLFYTSKDLHWVYIFTKIIGISGILDAFRELLYFPKAFCMHIRVQQRNAVENSVVSTRLQLYKVAGKW